MRCGWLPGYHIGRASRRDAAILSDDDAAAARRAVACRDAPVSVPHRTPSSAVESSSKQVCRRRKQNVCCCSRLPAVRSARHLVTTCASRFARRRHGGAFLCCLLAHIIYRALAQNACTFMAAQAPHLASTLLPLSAYRETGEEELGRRKTPEAAADSSIFPAAKRAAAVWQKIERGAREIDGWQRQRAGIVHQQAAAKMAAQRQATNGGGGIARRTARLWRGMRLALRALATRRASKASRRRQASCCWRWNNIMPALVVAILAGVKRWRSGKEAASAASVKA